MSKAKIPSEKNPDWHQFTLNFKLTGTLKKEVLALVMKKLEKANKMLELPEDGLEAVCSSFFSVEIFEKPKAVESMDPDKFRKGEAINLGAKAVKATQLAFAGAASPSSATELRSSGETITYRGAVKDPPPTPDPLVP